MSYNHMKYNIDLLQLFQCHWYMKIKVYSSVIYIRTSNYTSICYAIAYHFPGMKPDYFLLGFNIPLYIHNKYLFMFHTLIFMPTNL